MSADKDAHYPLPWTAAWIILPVLAALLNALLVYFTGGSRGFFLPSLATLICLLAALFDAFTHRIPNHLTYGAILAGLFLNSLVPLLQRLHAQSAITFLGAPGWRQCLLGLLVCGTLALLANLLAQIHGGDLKLLIAVGSMLGLSTAASATLLALIFALIYSILNLALVGRLNKVLHIGAHRALELFFFRRIHTPAPDEPVTAVSHIPMAIPLALGIALMLFLQVRYGPKGALW